MQRRASRRNVDVPAMPRGSEAGAGRAQALLETAEQYGGGRGNSATKNRGGPQNGMAERGSSHTGTQQPTRVPALLDTRPHSNTPSTFCQG